MFLLSRGWQRLPAIISCYKSHSDETAVARLDVSPVMKPINQLPLTLDLIRYVEKERERESRWRAQTPGRLIHTCRNIWSTGVQEDTMKK